MCCDGGVGENGPAELREVAERLVGEAASFVRGRRSELFDSGGPGGSTVRTKSGPTDPVTLADTETEQLIRDRLAELRPGESILGEEGGGGSGDGPVRWVVDPIDGTVNFVYGIPAYGVSVGAYLDGVAVAGAVADVAGAKVYSAATGMGAHCLSAGVRRPLRCSAATDLSLALVGTGFGYDPERRAAQAALVAGMLPRVRDIRRIGSAALDLCLVAAGRLDAYYEHGLNEWDWAAGAVIAAEAGALVTLPEEPGGLLVAAAPGVAAALLASLDALSGLGSLS